MKDCPSLFPYNHLLHRAVVEADDIDAVGQPIDPGRAGGEGKAADELAGEGYHLRLGGAVGGDEEEAVAGGDGATRMEFGVGYRIGVLHYAADRDGYVGADVLHEVGTVARTGGDHVATTGRHDGLRLVVVLVEGEVEAEGAPRLDLVIAGYRVGCGSFHGRKGNGVVDGWDVRRFGRAGIGAFRYRDGLRVKGDVILCYRYPVAAHCGDRDADGTVGGAAQGDRLQAAANRLPCAILLLLFQRCGCPLGGRDGKRQATAVVGDLL